jgi:predicted nucleotidyltransferase
VERGSLPLPRFRLPHPSVPTGCSVPCISGRRPFERESLPASAPVPDSAAIPLPDQPVRAADALSPRQLHAARSVIARVRSRVGAELVQASLFGSRARGDAGPGSDVDLLLVFRHLPPHREPFATRAERVAEAEAARLRVPVSVWSVSLIDLACGNRTPMLVDALADSLPLWCDGPTLPAIPFTPRDALGCVRALLQRTEEGSEEVAAHLRRGRTGPAAQRIREDVVRLCTAAGLLEGVTRPRRGEAVARYLEQGDPQPSVRGVLEWARGSFGPDGKDEQSPVPTPPGGIPGAARAVEALRRDVVRRARRLQDCENGDGSPA